MNIEIREAKPEEIEEIIKVTNDAFNIPYQKENLDLKYNEFSEILKEEFKSGKTKVLIAVLNNKIIGAQRYLLADEKYAPYINNETRHIVAINKLAVLKEYRNQGIGEKLMAEVEKKVRNEGCQIIVLDCMLEKKLSQHYKKLGFEEYKNIEHLDHHDIYMFKNLK